MPATYEKIQSTTLSSPTNVITFTSIPASWTDIDIVLCGTLNSAGQEVGLTFNNDTGSNYSDVRMRANGSAASSFRDTSYSYLPLTVSPVSTSPTYCKVTVFSYANSTFKSILSESSERASSTAGWVSRTAGLWRSTSAITSITLTMPVSNFDTGTIATIYGILRA
jgi:hypothetical protein